MRRYKKIFLSLIIISFVVCCDLLLFTSCKTRFLPTITKSERTKSDRQFFDNMITQSYPFETFHARIKGKIKLPKKSYNSTIDLKIKYNEALQISVRPLLGIEIYRIECSRDSFKFIDRMGKRYFMDSYSNLRGKMPINFNFYNLQALFTNQVFIPGSEEVSSKDYRFFAMGTKKYKEQGLTSLRYKRPKAIQVSFLVNNEAKIEQALLGNSTEKYQMSWNYSHFKLIKEGSEKIFPEQINVEILEAKKNIAEMQFFYQSIGLNEDFNFSFPISSRYKRIEYTQVRKLLFPKTEK